MHGQSAIQITMQMGQHQVVLPTTTISGKVAKVGFYRDTLPLLIITIKKDDAAALPYKIGERVSVPFVIGGTPYIAGLRATTNSSTVMICSDLTDNDLNSVRLVDVLFSKGWTQKEYKFDLTIKQENFYHLELKIR